MKINKSLISDLKANLIVDIENIKSIKDLKEYLDNVDNIICSVENTIDEYEAMMNDIESLIAYNEKYVLFDKGYNNLLDVIKEVENCFKFSDTYMKFHIKEIVDNSFILEMQGKEDITDLTELSIFDTMTDEYNLSILKMYNSYYVVETDKIEEQILKIEDEIIDNAKILLEDSYNRGCLYTNEEYQKYVKNIEKIMWSR